MSKIRVVKFMDDPTPADKAELKGSGVVLRNTRAYREGEGPEDFTHRVGDAPGAYGELPEFKGGTAPAAKGDDDKLPSISKMKVDEIKAELKERGVSFDDGAAKKVLAPLLEEAREG